MSIRETPPEKVDINTGKSNINIGDIEGLVNVSEVHMNVSQELIVTTEDKIRLSLNKYLKKMERKRGFITPLGLVISFTMILITAGFKDAGLDAATWRAIFIVADAVAFGWLIYAFKESLTSVKMEDIIEELKRTSNPRKIKHHTRENVRTA
jgi:hypothetical protein